MTYPDRIFLIGMPGAGKSTFGKFLAKEIGYKFVDLDELIEEQEGKSIADIFSGDGEDKFREIERDVLRAQTTPKSIISTGGGAPCFHDNMQWMNESGLTLFLNPGLEVILERVREEDHRPLLQGDQELRIRELFEKRISIYSQAGLESSSTDPCEILSELQNFIASDARN